MTKSRGYFFKKDQEILENWLNFEPKETFVHTFVSFCSHIPLNCHDISSISSLSELGGCLSPTSC